MCRFFKADEAPEELLSELTERQRRLVVAAINYHSLIQPGRTLRYKVYVGERWQYPRLTDVSTIDGGCTEQAGLEPVVDFEATSTVRNHSTFSPHYVSAGRLLIDRNIRYILITPDDSTDEDVASHQPQARMKTRVYKKMETTVPVAFDYVREVLRKEREWHGRKPIPLFEPATVTNHDFAHDVVGEPTNEIAPGPRDGDARKAVIISMHWLQAGGAERWGMETIRLAKEAGFLPIVLTDRDSQQPWITQSICDNALVIPLTMPLQQRLGDEPLLRALFEQFDIRAVLIHHCQWMYDRAWWVKKYAPDTCVVDSLHIVEHVMQGGYPREAIAHDQWIDLHHVISPQLEHWMVRVHNIPADKVVDAPLIGLTANSAALRYKERGSASPFVVSFIGRMARQKRPEAFILLARYLENKRPGAFRFILHGSGEMDGFVDRLIHRYHLEQVIERRSGAAPVARTYGDGDALVVSSINEGITLTTIEAISAGVPVLSADVGSQGTLVPPVGLLPRLTASFVSSAAKALMRMADREPDRRRLWEDEARRLVEFSKLQSADALFSKLFEQWSK
jgi:glycosyltransferase involved in cell wall biosynthesis